jgi:hypothetical protein
VVLLSIFGVAAKVSAVPDSDSSQVLSDKPVLSDKKGQPEVSYKAPYPFTADELWGKILRIVGLPNGYVTKEQVENIFGVTMKPDEEYLKQFGEEIYTLMREKDWYFNMSVGKNFPTRSFFFFNWGEVPGTHAVEFSPPPPGMCIDINSIRPALVERGWALREESPGINGLPSSKRFRKPRYGLLKIEFYPSDNCLRAIRISASKTANDQLPY